jgi:hypothetical protein
MEVEEQVEADWRSIERGIKGLQDAVKTCEEDHSECFFTIADLRKRVAELETSLMESRRDCEIARLHLGSEMRSNSSLRGQITKLKNR